MNYLTQTGILFRGILSGVISEIAGLFNIQGYIDMAKAIFSGQLNLKTLFAGLADNHYVYVLMHLWVLNPFKGASNNDVTEMGKHIGGIVYDIAAAMVGAAAAKVLSVLKATKVGSKIASTLSKAKCKIKSATIGKITKKTYCFAAGTPVLLVDGMKPIEEVRKGDWVWSVAPETGNPELKQVEDVFVNETDEIVHVRYGDTEIDATPTHPFYVAEKGWVSAVNLRAGDRLQLVNGEYVTVEQVQHEILESPVKVYNFRVADNHTYYVGNDGEAVLVHNANCNEFNKWLNKGKKDNKVYFGVDKDTMGKTYTGITKQRTSARLSQHNRRGKNFAKLDEAYTGLTRNQARSIEQFFIENGPNAKNQIMSISKSSKYYKDAMKWAGKFLNRKG